MAVPASNGIASTLTHPLVAHGWFCAQVRSNADARALWCRIRRSLQPGTPQVQLVQFVVDRDDELVWAWFPEPDPVSEHQDGTEVVSASTRTLTALWPRVGERIDTEVSRYYAELRDRAAGSRPSEGVANWTWQDPHARYSYSSLHGMVVEPHEAPTIRWPYGAQHYATAMSATVADLEAGGYDCHYPPQTICNRPRSNGSFMVNVREDQIVAARFGIGSIVEGGRQRHPLSAEFPHGLTFLADPVQEAITARIESARMDGRSFTGIVAGTVVIIDARRSPARGADFAAYLHIQIGVPLAGTLPI